MTCETVLDHAAGFLDGGLGAAEREAVSRHLASCEDCRDLLGAIVAAQDEPGLTEAILARTSGTPCARARSLLCARVDAELDSGDAELVDGHLRGCPACGALAGVLRRLRDELPGLAAVDPGPGFAAAVLARTSGRARREPRRAAWIAALYGLFDRPRIALEGAFVAAAVVAVPLAGIHAPLAQAPLRAVVHVRGAANEIEAGVVAGTRAVWATTESFVVENSTAAVAQLSQRTAHTLRTIRQRHGTISGPRASGEESGGTGPPDRRPETAQENER